MKFTIITVCYNAKENLLRTIESVEKQSYPHIDYIIEDGNSQDGSFEVVQKKGTNCPIRWFSQKDNGIYDAMNIAAQRARGEYILFLNAGDVLADEKVIERLADEIEKQGCGDIYFGNVIFVDKFGKRINRKYAQMCAKKGYYLSGDAICHQTIVAKTECVQKMPFLLEYKICADREWILRHIDRGSSFTYLDIFISICEMEGFSTNHQELYEKEVKLCIRNYIKMGYPVYMMISMFKRSKCIRSLMRKAGSIFFSK